MPSTDAAVHTSDGRAVADGHDEGLNGWNMGTGGPQSIAAQTTLPPSIAGVLPHAFANCATTTKPKPPLKPSSASR
ncbi:hypothetical protein, partial [Amycolatopsis magusensis]|uniref:hypothetical protein n=1 Tax=Amycolatopsis magusensis TaxID=882444 RepID=UPI0024A7EE55